MSSVAFIDNGSGMVPQMARYTLTWGGGTHFDEPDFIGKFGFGLPNASINQTRRTLVYTRTQSNERFRRACLDIDTYREFDRQTIPAEEESDLPDFVERYASEAGIDLDHGTVVVWEKPDRLTYRTPAKLKEHLLSDFGVVYRYLIMRGTAPLDILVDGTRVEPVDPLFLMPEGRLYVSPEEGGAECTFDETIPVYSYIDENTGHLHLERIEDEAQLDRITGLLQLVTSTIRVRIARLPLGFARGTGQDKSDKTDAYRRLRFVSLDAACPLYVPAGKLRRWTPFPKLTRTLAKDWDVGLCYRAMHIIGALRFALVPILMMFLE